MSTAAVLPDIRAALQGQVDAWRALELLQGQDFPGTWVPLEFILRNGTLWAGRPLPRRYTRRMPKQCFANCRKMVRATRGKLRYAEGYAMRGGEDTGFTFHHAWCVGPKGDVFDPTLRDPELYAYLGVFDDSTATGSLLDTGYGINLAGILARDPGLADLLPERLKETAS